jgi:hypothetical protein
MISIVGYLEEIDATGGLFPALRRVLMRGDHERRHEPVTGRGYVLLVDGAGEDEAEGDATSRLLMANRKRDATTLTVVDVAAPYGQLPTYRAVDRQLWLGVKNATLYGKILALAHYWRATFVVVNATGVGAGLASFLEKSLGDRLIAVQFSPKVKSELGWDLGRRDRPLPRLRGGRRAGHAPILVRGRALPARNPPRPGPVDALGPLGDPRLRRPHRPRPRRPAHKRRARGDPGQAALAGHGGEWGGRAGGRAGRHRRRRLVTRPPPADGRSQPNPRKTAPILMAGAVV